MFVDRLLRSAREHEVVLYDFLGRLYDAHAARDRSRAPAADAPDTGHASGRETTRSIE
jgi:hypothetical protein